MILLCKIGYESYKERKIERFGDTLILQGQSVDCSSTGFHAQSPTPHPASFPSVSTDEKITM